MNIAQSAGSFVTRAASLEFWLYGLVSGFIGGGATAAVSAGSIGIAHASGVDVPNLNFKAVGIIFLSAGVSNALMYLSKSPLPPMVTVTETTSTISQTEKTTVATKTVPESEATKTTP